MGGKASTWIGGTVVVALIIAAGGWFLAISPTLASSSQASSDAQDAEDRNDQLQIQLATLKKQFENLDAYKAELALAQTEIPAGAELANFIRELSTLAEASGTSIVSIVPGLPADVMPAAPPVVAEPVDPAAAEGAPAEGEAPAESEAPADGAAVAPVAPTGPAVIPGFVAVPIEVTVVSNLNSAVTFLSSLQATNQRLFLVTALKGAGQSEQAENGGRPATAEGDVELTITGYIYVLEADAATTPAPTDPAAPPAPLPVPDGSKDPLTSL